MQTLIPSVNGNYFNPPSPCGEGLPHLCKLGGGNGFQSTLPVWGGTLCSELSLPEWRNFNPPSPCGEGLPGGCFSPCIVIFQSTLPVWGGTSGKAGKLTIISISIHPPRVGRDGPGEFLSGRSHHFNPPSPCGEGLFDIAMGLIDEVFQSTLPVWGGTGKPRADYFPDIFQSTLPVWGGTTRFTASWQTWQHFNPPSPCGEGQQKLTKILCKLLR